MPGDGAHLEVHLRLDAEGGAPPRLDLHFASDVAVSAIMGPSGAGKTTLIHCIAGLVRPSAGRILVRGEGVFDGAAGVWVPPHRRRVALVPQSLALFPHLRVWRNVAYGARARTPRERKDVALAWLERARAAHLAERWPATLSGGEAQRVALARALASEPRLVLLDEPFSALDRALRIELGEALRELLASTHTPALLVTHDVADAERLASRLLALEGGRLRGERALSPGARASTPG